MITQEQYINEDKNEVFSLLLKEIGWEWFSIKSEGIDNCVSKLEYLFFSGILDEEIERYGELNDERLKELMRTVSDKDLEKTFNAEQIVVNEDSENANETDEEKLTRQSQKALPSAETVVLASMEKKDPLLTKEQKVIEEHSCLLKQLIDKIKQLEIDEQQKVFAYYLLTINLLAHWVDTKPSNMPEQIQKAFENVKDGTKLTVSDKRNRIENAALYTGVWHEIGETFKKELNCNYFEKSQEKFKEYSESLGTNPARSWKTLCDKLLNGLATKYNQKVVELVKEDLLLCVRMHHSKLSVLKERYLKNFSVHEINTRAAVVTCCPEYAQIIALLSVQEAADQKYKKISGSGKLKTDLLKKYQTHYRKCETCKKYHKELVENLKYRLGLFSKKWDVVAGTFYPIHKLGENNFPIDDLQTAFKYYKKIYNEKPSDLYTTYLDILHKHSGKKGDFKPTAKNKKEQQNRGSTLGYALETRCMCGAVNRYKLNALRFPRVIVGRMQEDGVPVAHINLCADEERKLSRQQCYFKYIADKKDWIFGVGNGDSAKPMDLGKLENSAKRILYMTKQDLFSKLDDIKTAGGDKVACEKALKHCWKQLGVKEQIPLSEIALIRVVSSSGFKFQGEKSKGVYHPIFGLLENTAWLLEINANRADQSIIASAIEKSVLAD